MLNQRLLIETFFALPRAVCGLLCSTVFVLGFYANDGSAISESGSSNVASVVVDKNAVKNKL